MSASNDNKTSDTGSTSPFYYYSYPQSSGDMNDRPPPWNASILRNLDAQAFQLVEDDIQRSTWRNCAIQIVGNTTDNTFRYTIDHFINECPPPYVRSRRIFPLTYNLVETRAILSASQLNIEAIGTLASGLFQSAICRAENPVGWRIAKLRPDSRAVPNQTPTATYPTSEHNSRDPSPRTLALRNESRQAGYIRVDAEEGRWRDCSIETPRGHFPNPIFRIDHFIYHESFLPANSRIAGQHGHDLGLLLPRVYPLSSLADIEWQGFSWNDLVADVESTGSTHAWQSKIGHYETGGWYLKGLRRSSSRSGPPHSSRQHRTAQWVARYDPANVSPGDGGTQVGTPAASITRSGSRSQGSHLSRSSHHASSSSSSSRKPARSTTAYPAREK